MFKNGFRKIQEFINMVTGIMLMALCVIVFVQVIMRYFIGRSAPWSEELTRYLFVWIIFLSVNLGIRDAIEIKIDLLDMFCKGNLMKILQIVRYCISILIMLGCMAGSILMIEIGKMALSPTLQLPMCFVYLVFPIGFLLNMVEMLIKIKDTLTEQKSEPEGGI